MGVADSASAGAKRSSGRALDVLTMAAAKAGSGSGVVGRPECECVSTVAPQIPDSLVVVAKIRRGRPRRSEQGPASAVEQALVTKGYQQIVDQIAHDASEDNGGRRRQFVCTVAGCGKVFYQRAHLNIHIRSHTGYKPYACQHPGCGKSFPQLGNMRTHERTHTGDRPFKCHVPGCLKAFSQRGNLKTHLKKVHNDDASPAPPREPRRRAPAGRPSATAPAVSAAALAASAVAILPVQTQAKISNVRAPAPSPALVPTRALVPAIAAAATTAISAVQRAQQQRPPLVNPRDILQPRP